MCNSGGCLPSGKKGVLIMTTTKVLSGSDEYLFLKKVCPKYDAVLKYKEEYPECAVTGSEWKRLRNLVACLLMLDAGLRVGEMIQVRYTDAYYNGWPVKALCVRAEIAKGKVPRTVPISERLNAALCMFRPATLMLEKWLNTQRLISRSLQGAPLTTRAVEKMTKWRGIESLNEPVNPHMLRHTFATKLMRITDMRTVQELLGHKNLNSTQRYTHPSSNDMMAAIDKMNEPQGDKKDVV